MEEKARGKTLEQLNKLRSRLFLKGLDSVKLRELLYRIINRPTWEYGMEVWNVDAQAAVRLERQLCHDARVVLDPSHYGNRTHRVRLSHRVPKVVLLGELQWETLETSAWRSKLRYAGKVKVMEPTRLVKQVLEAPTPAHHGHRSHRTFMEWVNAHLDLLGLRGAFEALVNPKGLTGWMTAVDKALALREQIEWDKKVFRHPDILLYQQSKHQPLREPYLFGTEGDAYRPNLEAALIQMNFRGGWTTITDLVHPERCRLCGNGTETPEHLLVECPTLRERRERLFDRIAEALHPKEVEGTLTLAHEEGDAGGRLVADWDSLSPCGKVGILVGKIRPGWSENMAHEVDRLAKDFCMFVWDKAAEAAAKVGSVGILLDKAAEAAAKVGSVGNSDKVAEAATKVGSVGKRFILLDDDLSDSSFDMERGRGCGSSTRARVTPGHASVSTAGGAFAPPGVNAQRMASS
jgi:hypothetical protein